MKLNQKGYMLVELVLSSVLAMTIALYLINLTYQFKNKNEDIYQSITYSKDKIAITKNIMNDLENKKIVSINSPVQKGDTFTIDFQVLVGDNFDSIESRRIKVVKNHEKDNTSKDIATTTTIYYGKINGEDYLKEDVSYYERTLDKNLTVGKIASKYENDYLTLNIPIQSIYSSDNYDIKLLLKCSAIPIIQSVSRDYSEKIWKYKDRITKIVFEDRMNPKKSVGVMSFDVSSLGNGSVMTYLVPDVNNTYIAYIQGDGGVLANQNSSYLFSNFSNLVSIDGLEKLNTSNVTNMVAMFERCRNLATLDLSHFDTSKVESMNSIFFYCEKIENLNLSHFDTSKVRSMSSMFSEMKNLSNIIFGSNFDTSNVGKMNNMFSNCEKIENLNLSHFDTKKVREMVGMFSNCYMLSELNLSSFYTESLINIGGNSKVRNVTYESLNYGSSYQGMFEECKNLIKIDMSNFNFSKVVNMNSLFSGCEKLSEIIIKNFDSRSVKDISFMFRDCKNLVQIPFLDSFNTSNVENMNLMFYNCENLSSLNLDSFDTSNVTSMVGMFEDCMKLTFLDLSNFNTAKVTNMARMFAGCRLLKEIIFSSKFTTSIVTNMDAMFSFCFALQNLDLKYFTTTNVVNMDAMFLRCYQLKNLDLCSFNVTNVRSFIFMFADNSDLNLIKANSNDWKIDSSANVTKMFENSGVNSVTYGQCS